MTTIQTNSLPADFDSWDIDKKKEFLKLLRQKEAIQKDSTLKNMTFGIIQRLFICTTVKTALLLGSNRSGKSEALAVDASIISTGVIPDSLLEDYPKDKIRVGECWISALDFPSTVEITQKKIDKILPKRYVTSKNKELKLYKINTGNEIAFKSAESGREKYQGTSKILIVQDEEHPKDIYDECYMRTTDCEGLIRIGFTPIKGMTWAYEELYKKAKRYYFTENEHGIKEDTGVVHTLEEVKKLKQRRLCIKQNPSNEANEDIEVYTMTIYDNIHLPDIEIIRAEEKWKDDPINYNARILGTFAKITGRNIFPCDILLKRQKQVPSTFWQGDLVNRQLKQHPKGNLIIFGDLKKIKDLQFVIGADISEGLETGDPSCFQILNRHTKEQFAIYTGKPAIDEIGVILYDLGVFFNNALIVPEVNFQGVGVVDFLRKYYFNIFSQYDMVKESLDVSKNQTSKRYGFRTDARTKPIMIRELVSHIRFGTLKVNCLHTIEELITYVFLKDGSMGAMQGCFDDRVMALALALQGILKRKYKPSKSPLPVPKEVRDRMGYFRE